MRYIPGPAWLASWQRAGAALAEMRRRRLRTLTDAEALAECETLLSLVPRLPLDPRRRRTSGLVEQQAVLHSRH